MRCAGILPGAVIQGDDRNLVSTAVLTLREDNSRLFDDMGSRWTTRGVTDLDYTPLRAAADNAKRQSFHARCAASAATRPPVVQDVAPRWQAGLFLFSRTITGCGQHYAPFLLSRFWAPGSSLAAIAPRRAGLGV